VLASLTPEKVDHLAALSAGNPVTFRRTLAQREKSCVLVAPAAAETRRQLS